MTAAFSAWVTGNAVPQPRPRFTRTGRAYTPREVELWKRHVRHALWHEAAPHGLPMDAPVELSLLFYVAPPAGWPKWKATMAEEGGVAHTTRPDADNLAKAVMDAATGVLWTDDTQVFRLRVDKLYGKPGVFIHAVYRTTLLPAQVTRRPLAAKEAARA